MVNNREARSSKQINADGPRASGHSHVTADVVLSSERPPWEPWAEGAGACPSQALLLGPHLSAETALPSVWL